MATPEMMLLCKIVAEGVPVLKEAIEQQLTPEDFVSEETRSIYKYVLATYQETGTIIGPHLASTYFSQLPLHEVDPFVTTQFLCKQVRTRRICSELSICARDVSELAVAGRHVEAFNRLQEGAGVVMRLDGGKNTDVDAATGLIQVLERYERLESGELTGIATWPWAIMEEATGGVQDDDFIVFYGRPKSMKTWVLLYMVFWALMMQPQEKRILVYTKEMTPLNLCQRLAAIICGMPYKETRLGKLAPEYRDQFFRHTRHVIEMLTKDPRLYILSAKDAAGRDTVSWLKSKIERYQPHMVFIDGMYLMSAENPKIVKTNEKLESISRAVRQMILDTHIPVIATLQANRKAAGHQRAELDEIAHSDAIAQDCTAAIRVIKSKESDEEFKARKDLVPIPPPPPTLISCIVGGSREWDLAGFQIHGDPASDFTFVKDINEGEALGIASADDPKEEPKPAKVTNGKGKTKKGTSGAESNYERAMRENIPRN